MGLPREKRRANLAAGAGYVIAANTQHPEAAWTFLKFLVSPKGQAIFAETGLAVPARRSVAQSEIFTGRDEHYKAQVFLNETEIGEPNFAFPGSHDITALMNEALVPVWQGQQDAASAIQGVLPKIETIVAESRNRL